MPAHFTHKTYRIDVNLSRDPLYGNLFTPTVSVGPEGGRPVVNIGTSKGFSDEKDAEACGFELARRWIDKE